MIDMTREEAIDRIREHMIHHKLQEPNAVLITHALEMAIAALNSPISENGFVYITLLKGIRATKEITGVYLNKDLADKAIAIPEGYVASGIFYETIEKHELKGDK